MSLSDARRARAFAALPARWRTVALLAPLLTLDGIVFLVPMGYPFRLSLTGRTTGGAFVEGSWSLSGDEYVAGTPPVHEIFAFTMVFVVLVTALAVAIAVVYADAACRATGWWRTVLLAGAVLSLFTTVVVKLSAVVLAFSPRGVLNDLLVAARDSGATVLPSSARWCFHTPDPASPSPR